MVAIVKGEFADVPIVGTQRHPGAGCFVEGRLGKKPMEDAAICADCVGCFEVFLK